MNKNALITSAAIGVIILVAVIFYLTQSGKNNLPQTNQSVNQTQNAQEGFETPKKAAHWEGNTPEHGITLAGVPINVVIDFNFDLAQNSEIKISSNSQDFTSGPIIIDDNKLAMRAGMNPESPDGLYTVSYKACWADGSCHDGSFQFKIDRELSSTFTDITGQNKITIEIQNIAFTPQKVKISKGTTVTWSNLDNFDHTVNTDSHPAHTYFLDQNSKTLANGNTYSVTFETPGIYLYHCTPHAGTMTGQILVD